MSARRGRVFHADLRCFKSRHSPWMRKSTPNGIWILQPHPLHDAGLPSPSGLRVKGLSLALKIKSVSTCAHEKHWLLPGSKERRGSNAGVNEEEEEEEGRKRKRYSGRVCRVSFSLSSGTQLGNWIWIQNSGRCVRQRLKRARSAWWLTENYSRYRSRVTTESSA